MRLIITKQWKLFTVCREQVRSPYIEHAASGLPNPNRLEREVRFVQAGVTTRCPRMVTECLLTRSMLIKMYQFTISGYMPVYVHCIYSQSMSCRRSLSLFSLFLFDTTILSESMSMSHMFWWDLKSSKSKKPFKFHSPYSLLICSISACSQHQYLLPWFLCISFDLQKERTKERKKEPFFSNRELLSTRKHWTINPSLAQARHRYYRHIAFISFQLQISTPFRKLSPPPPKKKKIHCIQ